MKRWMKELYIKKIREVTEKYDLIKAGDRILVGVSGGKDSALLLFALGQLKSLGIYDFELSGFMVNNGLMEDTSEFLDYFKEQNIPIYVHKEKFELENSNFSPCYTCARIRKGILKREAIDRGFNKIAFGHTSDDIVETFLMNIIKHGKMSSIPPTLNDTSSALKIIRPLIFMKETDIIRAVDILKIPIVRSTCTFAKDKLRMKSEAAIDKIEDVIPGFSEQLIKAMGNIDNERLLTVREEAR